MLGSVRGVASNDHSYRDKANPRVPTPFRVRKATRFGRAIARSERPGVAIRNVPALSPDLTHPPDDCDERA
jgi:hypothetical protein